MPWLKKCFLTIIYFVWAPVSSPSLEYDSLRSWRDFVKSRVEFPPAQIGGVFLIMRSPVHANLGLAEITETSIKC